MRKSIFIFTLLAALLCLGGCTRRAAENPPPAAVPEAPAKEPDIQTPAAPADGPLSEEELAYFNGTFFNGEDFNIRNQFLSSTYDTPADVNLYELFYCGSGQGETMTEEEWAAFEAAGGFVDTDVTKVSTAGADAVLAKYTGLTLEETRKIDLDSFTYLPEYDAYYLAHGDTNYRGFVEFAAGRREGGLVRLYYEDTFMADGWKCVTLRETGDGGYQFVSHTRCDPADVPN